MIRLILTLAILSVFACGPSKEDRERAQRVRDDSVRTAVLEKIASIDRLKDSITSAERHLKTVSKRLVEKKGELEASRDRLIRIKDFQFLRTVDEREQQIKNQTVIVENLEIEVGRLAIGVDEGELTIKKLKTRLSSLK